MNPFLADELLEGRRLRVREREVLAYRRHQRVLRFGLKMEFEIGRCLSFTVTIEANFHFRRSVRAFFLSVFPHLSLHGGLDLCGLRDGVGEVALQSLRPGVGRPLRRLERRREERLLGVHVVRRQRVH